MMVNELRSSPVVTPVPVLGPLARLCNHYTPVIVLSIVAANAVESATAVEVSHITGTRCGSKAVQNAFPHDRT